MSRSKIRAWKVVFGKELRDALRDRRAILVAMLPALFAPLAMMLMLSSAAKTRIEAAALELPVRGAVHAPDLIAYLEQDGVRIVELEGDPRPQIRAKTIPAALVISEDFAERFRASEPAEMELYVDASLDKSDAAADRVLGLVRAYNRNLGSLRLMVRGIDPNITRPVDVEIRDFSTRTSRAGLILNTLQLILLMAAFFGGAGVAIDATAGERERHSWEPLLVHPVRSVDVAAGKLLTVTLFASSACLLSVFATAIALRLFSLEALGIDPYLSPTMQAGLFALQLPLAVFASALQMMVSIFAKSFKEAQGYIGILTLLPMLPVMLTMFQDIKTETWMYLVPIAGQQQLMTAILRGDPMPPTGFALVTITTLALAALLFALLTRLLRTERVVFGN